MSRETPTAQKKNRPRQLTVSQKSQSRKRFGGVSVGLHINSVIVRIICLAALLLASYVFSHEVCSWLLCNGDFPNYRPIIQPREQILIFALPIVLVQLVILYGSGVYRSMLRYFPIRDALVICSRIFVAVFLLLILSFVPDIGEYLGPKRVLFLDFFVASAAVCTVRVLLRFVWERNNGGGAEKGSTTTRIAIFGAGDAGSMLAAMLKQKPKIRKLPVVFFDDSKSKRGLSICGIPVVGPLDDVEYWRKRYKFDEIAIAIPTAKISRVREIRKIAADAGLKVTLTPSLEELSLGKMSFAPLREFDIADLLDRPKLDLNGEDIAKMLNGKVVLVTGAGGSIGSEICRQVVACTPARLILVEQCEVLMFPVEQDLIANGCKECIVPEIADILDAPRMDEIFRKYRPEIIFHAAAHKHVPLMERQPAEALKNNSLGSLKIFELATKYETEACVMISTDKAINPTSAMGVSKRIAEIMLQSISQKPGNKTRFMAVRFGNVLGSSGSVIPTFKKQIAAGGPLTVTSAEMKRYFMTIPEAVGLVLQTGVIGKNGSIYVLDMGEPVKIIDIARHLIRLSGLEPGVDIDIEITGLRPGEKLFEELKSSGEDYEPSGHPRITRFKSTPLPYEKLYDLRDLVGEIAHVPDRNKVKEQLCGIVPEYRPSFD